QRPGAYLWSIAAGPLVNVLLMPFILAAFVFGQVAGLREQAPDVYQYLFMLVIINVVLLVFNLLPIFPLDGGQILRALLWFLIGRGASLLVVSVLGLVCGLALLALTLAYGAWWLALMCGFGVLTSLGGIVRGGLLLQLAKAPHYEEFACPACG